MTTSVVTVTPMHVTCEVCMKEMPLFEAGVPEALDYVGLCCDVRCYDKRREQPSNFTALAKLPASRDTAR